MDVADVYLSKPPHEAIEQQMEQPLKAVIGTLNPDGSIHLAFVLYLWENGRLYFETASMTRKVRNIAERPTASFAVDPPGFMAMAEGTARIITGNEAHELNRRLRARYLTPEAVDVVGGAWETVDDVCIEITPHKWRSWSSDGLVELSKRAAGDDLPPDSWWLEPE